MEDKNQDREPKNDRKKLQWKKGSDVTYTLLLNSNTETLHFRLTITVSKKNSLFRSFSFFTVDRNFLLVNDRFIVSNPFTTVAIVSSPSLLKVACPLIRFGNGHFNLLRSVDREFRNLKQHFSKLLRNAPREQRPALAQQ